MSKHLIVFDPHDLLALLVHYTEGQVPRDAKCISLDRHPALQNLFRLICNAKDWPGAPTMISQNKIVPDMLQPLEFRYEGNKTMTWDDKGAKPVWKDKIEGPRGGKV